MCVCVCARARMCVMYLVSMYCSHRSPGAQARVPRSPSPSPSIPDDDDIYYIAVENQPPVAEQLYKAPPGQVFSTEDTSKVDVWKMLALSGENAGESVWVQRNTLEEYSASVMLLSLKKCFTVVNFLSRLVHRTQIFCQLVLSYIHVYRPGTHSHVFQMSIMLIAEAPGVHYIIMSVI